MLNIGFLVDRIFFVCLFRFFFFSTFNISAHCLLVSKVEKSVDNLTEDLLYVMNCFFLGCFQDSFFHFQQFDYDFVLVSELILLGFLDVSWKFSAIISSNILSASFLTSSPRILTMHMLVDLMVYYSSHRPCSFLLFFFFLFLILDNFHCPVFKFTDSSATLNLPLNNPCEFFASIIVFLRARISFLASF